MKLIRFGVLLGLFAVVAVMAADDGLDSGDFKAAAAKNAAETYNASLTKLTKDYKERCDAARKACINQLTVAQQSATKAGNLDEAIKIRDTIAKLQSEVQETPAGDAARGSSAFLAERQKLTKSLANTVWLVGEEKLRFNDDGTGVFMDGNKPDPKKNAWAWAVVTAHEVIIRYSSGWTNRLEFDEAVKSYVLHDSGSNKKLDLPGGKKIQ